MELAIQRDAPEVTLGLGRTALSGRGRQPQGRDVSGRPTRKLLAPRDGRAGLARDLVINRPVARQKIIQIGNNTDV